ncbi:MAG: bis(5'-nucleosyl)-tetraphosphatase (symmetrical) YqeK, partial [Vulcanimicrobiaceae bacterium]
AGYVGRQFEGCVLSQPPPCAARAVRTTLVHQSYADLARRVRAHIGQRHRYAHTVRVARCAELLAQRHALDTGKARLAGMLHDLARLYPAQRLVRECEARGMALDAFEREHPLVLHARLAAAIAFEAFGVRDESVLDAISKHTVAAASMSPLDCVIYLADGLEPERDFPERAAYWALAQENLTAAMRATLASSLTYLHRKGIPVAPQTAAAARAFGLTSEEATPSRN